MQVKYSIDRHVGETASVNKVVPIYLLLLNSSKVRNRLQSGASEEQTDNLMDGGS